MPRPPIPETSVRSAVAVRPPRPMTEIVGVHVYLDGAPATAGAHLDADGVRIGDDAANKMFDGIGDNGTHFSVASAAGASAVSVAAASSDLGASALGASASSVLADFFFLAVVASPSGSASA